MPANECKTLFEPGEDITCVATAAVVGKTFVSVSAPVPGGWAGFENFRVATTGAGLMAVGVASYDAVLNENFPVKNGPGKIVPVTAGAVITAGNEVQCDAAGRAVPLAVAPATPGKSLGLAMDSAANGADCPVRLYT